MQSSACSTAVVVSVGIEVDGISSTREGDGAGATRSGEDSVRTEDDFIGEGQNELIE